MTKIKKDMPPRDAEEKGLSLGYPAKPSGERTRMAYSKDSSLAKPKKDEDYYNYPAGSDRLEGTQGYPSSYGKERESGFAQKAEDQEFEIEGEEDPTIQAPQTPTPEWIPYTGEHGAIGAKNIYTGEIVYGSRAQSLLHIATGAPVGVDQPLPHEMMDQQAAMQAQAMPQEEEGMPGQEQEGSQHLNDLDGDATSPEDVPPVEDTQDGQAEQGEVMDPGTGFTEPGEDGPGNDEFIPEGEPEPQPEMEQAPEPEPEYESQGEDAGGGGPGNEGAEPLSDGPCAMCGKPGTMDEHTNMILCAEHLADAAIEMDEAAEEYPSGQSNMVKAELPAQVIDALQMLDDTLDVILEGEGQPGEHGPEAMSVETDGNVGLNSASPDAKLDIGSACPCDKSPECDPACGCDPDCANMKKPGCECCAADCACSDCDSCQPDDTHTDADDPEMSIVLDDPDNDGVADSAAFVDADKPAEEEAKSPPEIKEENEAAADAIVPDEEKLQKSGPVNRNIEKAPLITNDANVLRDLMASGRLDADTRQKIIKALADEQERPTFRRDITPLPNHSEAFGAVLKQAKDAGKSSAQAHKIAYVMVAKEFNPRCNDCFNALRLYGEPQRYFDVMKTAIRNRKVADFALSPLDYHTFRKEFPTLQKDCAALLTNTEV